ncbi:hypothetical protein CRE_31286 [Caenorhabditis remanei]|uniref:Uncharacterized protein n=1 Tax=Caenorhabditis remanei TaxID=31234 RepID=E3MLN2_CAERE|nr:hypothetical protein CRE_31286 [Caenorhabditis remanei]
MNGQHTEDNNQSDVSDYGIYQDCATVPSLPPLQTPSPAVRRLDFGYRVIFGEVKFIVQRYKIGDEDGLIRRTVFIRKTVQKRYEGSFWQARREKSSQRGMVEDEKGKQEKQVDEEIEKDVQFSPQQRNSIDEGYEEMEVSDNEGHFDDQKLYPFLI